MIFVCPEPFIWYEIYEKLEGAARKSNIASLPPRPLILSGWSYSNDAEKAQRWQAPVRWAKKHNLEHFTPEIPTEHKYMVNEMTSYTVGPNGGPMYLAWNFDSKEKPLKEELKRALSYLKENWASIAGGGLACITAPLRFSGIKKRRLIIKADKEIAPPWGCWDSLAQGGASRSFTEFRKRINGAIAPLMVDHIDFE